MSSLEKLLEIASDPLGCQPPVFGTNQTEGLAMQLASLLRLRNGFLAFESALHVFPADPAAPDDLVRWNARETWRDAYGSLADGCLFFAEDIFGEQFCIDGDCIARFNPETGERIHLASSFEGWAELLLREYREETGWPLAHEWQRQHGPLPRGQRLIPSRPFVLQGAYDLENLRAIDAVRGMRHRGALARQLVNVTDGEAISYVPLV